MDKTISILIEETRQNLAIVLNNSQLPPSVLSYILKDIYIEVERLSREEYRRDLENQKDKE